MKLIFNNKEVHPGESINIPYELETPYATIHTLSVELNDNTIPRLIHEGVLTVIEDKPAKITIEKVANAEEIFAAALMLLFEAWKADEQED